MSDTELVMTLKTLAAKDAAMNDCLHMFALRQRARYIITLKALQARMFDDGFKHTAKDYAGVLTALANCGIGTLDKDPKGRVRALKDIKISIPALGKAVLAGGKVKGYRKRTRYSQPASLPPEAPKAPTRAPEARQPRTYQVPGSKVVATVVGASGQVVANVTFSPDATKDDIAEFFRKQLESSSTADRDLGH